MYANAPGGRRRKPSPFVNFKPIGNYPKTGGRFPFAAHAGVLGRLRAEALPAREAS